MQPGDASMANNYAMCHSRSDFVDGPDPERRRLVLRAWIEVPIEDRRLPIGREFFHMENEGGRLGYDLVPGPRGSHRDQRLQQRRRGPRQPVQGGAGQAQARLTVTVRPRLVYFDQWTDPVAGDVLADHGGVDVDAPRDHRRRRQRTGPGSNARTATSR